MHKRGRSDLETPSGFLLSAEVAYVLLAYQTGVWMILGTLGEAEQPLDVAVYRVQYKVCILDSYLA